MSERKQPPKRGDYPHFLQIPTRWMDNDVYGHVNNVIYYSWIDTVVSHYLIDEGGFSIEDSEVIGIAAESGCNFFASVTYPDVIDAGLRIARLGNSSVTYEVGLFRHLEVNRADDLAAAAGFFVHVFVSRETMRPVPIPKRMRAAFERILS